MTTVRIPLSQGKFALVDEDDYVLVARFKWSCSNKEAKDTTRTRHAYAIAHWPGGKGQILMHRLIMMHPRPGVMVDHINGDGLDNRRCNLRLVNATQNLLNQKKRERRASTPYKGVYFHTRQTYKKPWFARLTINGKTHSLGYHATPEEAARAYDAAARRLAGEHARLNFPDDVS